MIWGWVSWWLDAGQSKRQAHKQMARCFDLLFKTSLTGMFDLKEFFKENEEAIYFS